MAAPDYLEQRGVPKSPKDLERHDCLVFGAELEGNVWTLHSGSRSVQVSVRARIAVNEPDMLRAVALGGAGVTLLPTLLNATDLTAGRLRRILPDWSSSGAPVHAVYPGSRHHSPKVMAFVDFLRERWPEPSSGTQAP